MTVTTNLSEFGRVQLTLARHLLNAMIEDGLPSDFSRDKVEIAFNTYSGKVFLTNSEFQSVIFNPDTNKLESFYSSPYDCHEGFLDDLLVEYQDMHPEDQAWLRDIAEQNDVSLPQLEQKK